MRLLYSLSIHSYGLFISIAALLGIKKAQLWKEGRKSWSTKLKAQLDSRKEIMWFHTASLGEFEQARPLIEAIKKKEPSTFILLSFFSPSGYEVRHNYKHADLVCYLPLDSTSNAKKFIKIAQPKLAIFVKYEFWFNYLNELNNNNIPTLLVSGIFRKKQHFFKWYGNFFRKGLNAFSHFFVQNSKSEKLLHSIGFNNTSVVGDTRLDQVINISKETFESEILTNFCEEKETIVIGSSWPKEHDFAIEFINRKNATSLIIAPHEINPKKVLDLKNAFGDKAVLWSEASDLNDLKQKKVLIIDTIGILSKVYRYAKIAFIGGGFGSGIHNTLEAAVYGVPVLFGPKHQKFQEAIDLIQNQAAFSISNYQEFEEKINQLLAHKEEYQRSARASHNYVHNNSGATSVILKHIASL